MTTFFIPMNSQDTQFAAIDTDVSIVDGTPDLSSRVSAPRLRPGWNREGYLTAREAARVLISRYAYTRVSPTAP